MSDEAVARRYALAIFEIGKEEGSLGALSKELAAFAEAYTGSEELQNVLANPLVQQGAREEILTEIAGRLSLSGTALNTLRLISRRRRMGAVAVISRELQRLVDEEGKVVRAEVTSVGPLSPAYLERLRGELERATGKKVVITERHDPSLIAGVVTRIGDRMIDGSLRARLSTFRDSLMSN